MLYIKRPKDFKVTDTVSLITLEHDGQMLLLRRAHHKYEGGKWGVPGGKVARGENKIQAILREVAEETGIILPAGKVRFLKTVFVRHTNYDYTSHLFLSRLLSKPKVAINGNEHTEYAWMTPREALDQDLVRDQDKCIIMAFPSQKDL